MFVAVVSSLRDTKLNWIDTFSLQKMGCSGKHAKLQQSPELFYILQYSCLYISSTYYRSVHYIYCTRTISEATDVQMVVLIVSGFFSFGASFLFTCSLLAQIVKSHKAMFSHKRVKVATK